MALGKIPRIDSRRSSSSCCSTVTVVMFVALCLVGVWMITLSVVDPDDISTPETKSDVKREVQPDKSFVDSSGDVSEDATKEDESVNINDVQEEANSEASIVKGAIKKATENEILEAQEGNSLKESEDAKNGSDDTSRMQTYHDTNGDQEGRELSKDGEQGDNQGQDVEHNASETGDSEQKYNENANSDQQQSEIGNESDAGEKSDGIQVESSGEQIEEKVEKEQIIETELSPVEDKTDDQNSNEQQQSENENKSGTEEESDAMQDKSGQGQIEEKIEEKQDKEMERNSGENKKDNLAEQHVSEVFPDGAHSQILNETNGQNVAWSTQAMESKNEKEAQRFPFNGEISEFRWKLCNVSAGPDYIPCLDNEDAIKKLPSTKHYEHRERHCPDEGPTCLVPLPEGYRQPTKWPESRDKIWYFNVPHTKLAAVKGHQNWVKVTGEYLTFPGGGTQFKHGALHYVDFIQETLPDIAWGKRSRVILDVGCGVASFGGYLFDRDVLTMSFAPKDEHEAQVQFALERGIPAISAVMGTKRLPFPSGIFDVVHCARCRVPWHVEGGTLLLELNRLLRPGGFFVWSATPVYRSLPQDIEIWKAMSELTKSMCWELVKIQNDTLNGVGVAIYQKPSSNECYENRKVNNPPLCQESDDPDAAWNVPLQACMHRVSVNPAKRGSQWPKQWPERLEATPYWLNSSQVGVYGKPAPEDFSTDYEHWKHVVSKSYLNGMGINWSNVRNVMDMRSLYGGFAAALREMEVWVMNVVPIESPDTLPIIYERGLFGIYHDWCESFSTYPRTYDLLHADHLFSKLWKRCKLLSVMAEVDRILRPEGNLIVRDDVETISKVQSMAKSLQWKIRLAYTKENEGLLCVQKTMWRPQDVEAGASETV